MSLSLIVNSSTLYFLTIQIPSFIIKKLILMDLSNKTYLCPFLKKSNLSLALFYRLVPLYPWVLRRQESKSFFGFLQKYPFSMFLIWTMLYLILRTEHPKDHNIIIFFFLSTSRLNNPRLVFHFPCQFIKLAAKDRHFKVFNHYMSTTM